ncbi:SRPBCC family protein [Antrihabitans cavernicola]|uniref:Dimethyladenosine transferase n=1 Tax=Antrihabitans cavernicola TaxID=2495913 RepID=A0A5A7S824_9NOCA|nr:SRPBCC family protein [Spelaeibacter cavernicola]KAA0021624.1 dimethyladenosine transferase [Spelaeibacter cavernicola]
MANAAVSTVETGKRKVTRRVTVNAPAAQVFDLVADPHRHPELDGSGTVRDTPVTGPDRLSNGAKFSVGMKQYGVPYKITSKVTAFQDDKLVEWQHPAGHRWRWEFAEVTPGTTQVTETFDYSTTPAAKVFELLGFPKANGAGITKTLEALSARFD